MTPEFFFQVFARNSLIKNIFEEEKSLIGEHEFFWKIVPNWMYFGQGQDFKLTTELSKKCNIATTKQSKSAYVKQKCLCQYMELYFQDRTLCVAVNQDLTLYEGDSNF